MKLSSRTREITYWMALLVAIIIGALVMFGVVDTEDARAAVGVVAFAFAGIFGMAAKNVTPDD